MLSIFIYSSFISRGYNIIILFLSLFYFIYLVFDFIYFILFFRPTIFIANNFIIYLPHT